MKRKLSIGVCILISLALVAFGLLFGTVRGYNAEREQVDKLLSGENGLSAVLDYMGADGLNLSVVANRHLDKDDADVSKLQAVANALRSEGAALKDRQKAADELSKAAKAVSDKLGASASFLGSQRDVKYLTAILSDLDQLSQSPVIQSYNTAVHNYNESLKDPVGGFFASILGIKQAQPYGGEQ